MDAAADGRPGPLPDADGPAIDGAIDGAPGDGPLTDTRGPNACGDPSSPSTLWTRCHLFGAGSPSAVAFAAPADVAVLGTREGVVKLVRLSTGEDVAVLLGHEQAVTAVAVDTNDTAHVIASASEDGSVRVWRGAADVACQKRIVPHRGKPVRALVLSADGRKIISAGDDGRVVVSDSGDGKMLASWPASEQPLQAVAIAPDGALVAAGGADGSVTLWALDGTARGTHALGEPVSAVAVGPAGSVVAAGGTKGMVRAFDLTSGAARGAFETAPNGAITQLRLTPDGRQVLTVAQHEGLVRITTVDGSAPVRTIPAPTTPPSSPLAAPFAIATDSTGARLLTVDSKQDVRVVRLGDGAPISTTALGGGIERPRRSETPDSVYPVSWSADGRFVVRGEVLFDTSVSPPRRVLQKKGMEAVSGDGKRIATQTFSTVPTEFGYESEVTVWDVATGGAVGKTRGYPSPLRYSYAAPVPRLIQLDQDGSRVFIAADEAASAGSPTSIYRVHRAEDGTMLDRGEVPGLLDYFRVAPDFRSVGFATSHGLGNGTGHVGVRPLAAPSGTEAWTRSLAWDHPRGAMAFSADGQRLAHAAPWGLMVRPTDGKGAAFSAPPVPRPTAGPLSFSPSGKLVLVEDRAAGTAAVYPVEGKRLLNTLRGADDEFWPSELIPVPEVLGFGADEKTLILARRPPRRFDGSQDEPKAPSLHAFDIATGKVTSLGMAPGRLSPDGTRLFRQGTAGGLEIVDLASRAIVRQFPEAPLFAVAAASNRAEIVVGGTAGGGLVAFRASDGMTTTLTTTDTTPPTRLAVSPNGQRVAARHPDRVVLYDLFQTSDAATPPLRTIMAVAAAPGAGGLQFSPDGSEILTWSSGGAAGWRVLDGTTTRSTSVPTSAWSRDLSLALGGTARLTLLAGGKDKVHDDFPGIEPGLVDAVGVLGNGASMLTASNSDYSTVVIQSVRPAEGTIAEEARIPGIRKPNRFGGRGLFSEDGKKFLLDDVMLCRQ